MNITLDIPYDWLPVLEIIESAAKIKGIPPGKLMVEILHAEILTWLSGGYPLGTWLRERLEETGLKEKYYPTKKQAKVIKELEKRRG